MSEDKVHLSGSLDLTRRVETLIDRWNELPREKRHELSGSVTEVSLSLAEFLRLGKALMAAIVSLEQRMDRAETSVPPG